MSGKKCKHCGSSEIEVDPARGDAVCTNCGTVLEDNIIVAEVEFQENAHGGASAIGQFVSADSKGGATGFGRGEHIFRGSLNKLLFTNNFCFLIKYRTLVKLLKLCYVSTNYKIFHKTTLL